MFSTAQPDFFFCVFMSEEGFYSIQTPSKRILGQNSEIGLFKRYSFTLLNVLWCTALLENDKNKSEGT